QESKRLDEDAVEARRIYCFSQLLQALTVGLSHRHRELSHSPGTRTGNVAERLFRASVELMANVQEETATLLPPPNENFVTRTVFLKSVILLFLIALLSGVILSIVAAVAAVEVSRHKATVIEPALRTENGGFDVQETEHGALLNAWTSLYVILS